MDGTDHFVAALFIQIIVNLSVHEFANVTRQANWECIVQCTTLGFTICSCQNTHCVCHYFEATITEGSSFLPPVQGIGSGTDQLKKGQVVYK